MSAPSMGRALLLLSTAIALLQLGSVGPVGNYLSPRNAALVPWTGLALLALGMVELFRLESAPSPRSRGWAHLVCLAPLVAGLCVRPKQLSVGYFAAREIAGWRSSLERTVAAPEGRVREPTAGETDSIGTDPTAAMAPPPAPPVGCPARAAGASKTDSVNSAAGPEFRCPHPARRGPACVDTIREGTWYGQMSALYAAPRRHLGRRVRFLAMADIARSPDRDWFLAGRMLVWCCAADAIPFGLHAMVPVGSTAPPSGWVEVEGRIAARRMLLPGAQTPREVPVVLDVVVEPAQAPAQPNVFPLAY